MNLLFSGGWVGDHLGSWPLAVQILVIASCVLIIGVVCIFLGVIFSKPPDKHL